MTGDRPTSPHRPTGADPQSSLTCRARSDFVAATLASTTSRGVDPAGRRDQPARLLRLHHVLARGCQRGQDAAAFAQGCVPPVCRAFVSHSLLYVYVHVHEHANASVCLCQSICTCICTCISIRVSECVCTCVYLHLHMYVHLCVYVCRHLNGRARIPDFA